DDVAIHDAAENVDEDSFHVRIAQDDIECGCDLFFAGAATDVEEVRGAAAEMLDDVHGGHGEAGAVDETGDVAVELDVIETVFAGFNFEGCFFLEVAHGLNVGMTIESVIIETDFGIDDFEDLFAISFLDKSEWVDFDHGGVGFPPGFENAGDELRGL